MQGSLCSLQCDAVRPSVLCVDYFHFSVKIKRPTLVHGAGSSLTKTASSKTSSLVSARVNIPFMTYFFIPLTRTQSILYPGAEARLNFLLERNSIWLIPSGSMAPFGPSLKKKWENNASLLSTARSPPDNRTINRESGCGGPLSHDDSSSPTDPEELKNNGKAGYYWLQKPIKISPQLDPNLRSIAMGNRMPFAELAARRAARRQRR